MKEDTRKIVIIGGGVAGLCTAVYAQRSGYQAEVLEMHETAGGLATSWHRDGYTFETCLHWLLGSSPSGDMYSRWREVFDIDRLTFVNPEQFLYLEAPDGRCFHVYSNVDRLEAEMLKIAPQDKGQIRHFASPVLHEYPRGADERVGEHYGADEEGSERPDERNAESRYDKHRETGGHGEGRDDDGLERHLPAPLAKPPHQYTNEAQQSNNTRRTWSE